MGSLAKPVICIVTPATRSANNGNWRTAARWAAMLHDRYRVIVQTVWQGESADALIALHARRSAPSVAQFAAAARGRRIAVVLTGTDLYRDLPGSGEAIASLDRADRLVVLQEDALRMLEPRWQRKCAVIYQSAPLLAPRAKAAGRLACVVVGHLREEKDPATVFEAMARLPRELPITLRHIGAALDPKLAEAARALALRDPRYRYSGALPHGLARAAIHAAHVLVHPSIMEGGANVVVEAITSGTPVVASLISGNVGLLGKDYPGYFEARDASGLAARLVQALESRRYLASLRAACARRRARLRPEAEARSLRALAAVLVA